ncbi:Pls/PosA family non-ribosomal peptide synthetase [Noviherbaspirillum galbum]|uniref:Amino acid adenylation domain-containing protein n=1 Tax=Noviherbaspirillum galbum TaxID=2709383 RepID=A0A6B3SF51_9BURK|nr:Pls/PosA family non-ribosomal peptide synthetase [Noviherbaspirillum galbum]NEX59527.1 amino acid adenylation domain-containing protein [Noviherbaspirillum galbum]
MSISIDADQLPASEPSTTVAGIARQSILLGAERPEFIRDEILADLLETTARRQPDHPALIDGERVVSYGELDMAANRVASRLIAAGVGPGQIIGLWLPRGADLLIMQAGIAKTGAAWLPFDADTPLERILICLADASSPGLVSCESFEAQLAGAATTTWMAEDLLATTGAGEKLRRRDQVLPTDPAYVIYTSGSTGKPKGIQISQGAICHFLRSENSVLGVRGDDRVYHGFSVAFDMSFEEIWISYLVGATLWIAPKQIAADPEALPRALEEQRITVLHAVPTLLALFERDLPGLRIINLGGEMCPDSLVARWARPGRPVFNSYGPTEATVSASMIALQAGEPVTIGAPLPNYGLLVVDTGSAGELKLAPAGETGELCITGPGVASGYLGRPELTAEKFVVNPWAAHPSHARMYRTGDLARIDEHGNVQCLGRTDDQVKIRGFRVELGEIEAELVRQAGVGTAAVVLRKDDGIEQLVAFYVADDESAANAAALRAALAERLPPYMVPGHFEALAEMPRLISGKIDRNTLKARPLEVRAPADGDAAATPAEEVLFSALHKLFPGQPLRRAADFFSDLGGHSLFAARLASALRTVPGYAHVTVRDIYQHRKVSAIAAAMTEGQAAAQAAAIIAAETAPRTQARPGAFARWRCGLAQAIVTPPVIMLRMAQWLAPFFTYHFLTGDPGDSVVWAVLASIGVFLLTTMLEFVVPVVGVRLLSAGIRPGRYPLWGMTYFRWWLGDRLVESAPAYLLSGSSLYAWWLRALGAKIGREVTIGSITLRSPAMLSIGDGASIGNAVNLENARVQNGELRLGRIDIGNDAFVGSYSVLEGGTEIGSLGHLDGQSSMSEGMRLPAGRCWSGSPARDTGAFTRTCPPRPAASRLRLAAEGVFFAVGALSIAAMFFLPVFPAFMLIDWLGEPERFTWLQSNAVPVQLLRHFLLALPATAVLIFCTVLLSAAVRWTVLPRLKPGTWAVHSFTYCRKWLVNLIQESSLNVLHGVYATVYSPFWYRLLGAKVGKDAEISSALGVVPDMLTLGDETFIADAVMLGDEHIDGGWMTMQPTVISRRSFVGNGSYIPDGTILPENMLVGVHSRAPSNAQMQPGDTWLGSPPINLPAREGTTGYPESLTFRPSPARRLCRALVEAFRIAAPHAIVTAVGYTLVLDLMPMAGAGRWTAVAGSLAIAGMLYGVGAFVFVALLKWLLLRRYDKRTAPMWTPFVWVSEAVTSLYEGLAVPNFLRYLRGTPWLPEALKAMGCRIGKGVYMDTTDITEFDCVSIGDHSEINALACPQTHLFEDRVMKIDHVRIGKGVYMAPRSAVLYGAEVGDRARLGALTLVMKGEAIPPASAWQGCPAAPAHG